MTALGTWLEMLFLKRSPIASSRSSDPTTLPDVMAEKNFSSSCRTAARSGIQTCAERIRLAVADEPILAEGSPLTITLSAGTTVLDPMSGTESDALIAADTALYKAKNAGAKPGRHLGVEPQSSLTLAR